MALPHFKPGEVISVLPLSGALSNSRTSTLVKTDELEVLRLVLPAGKRIGTHSAPGEALIQCLEGRVELNLSDGPRELTAGSLVYLPPAEPHSVRADADSSLLVTLLLSPATSARDYSARCRAELPLDAVDEASDESFPASDPTSHTPITGS